LIAIKAVLFDLDDTLMFEMTSERAAFLAAGELARQSHGLEPEALRQAVRREARAMYRAAPTYSYCMRMGISSWEILWGRLEGAEDANLKALRDGAPQYCHTAWSRGLAALGVHDASLAQELTEAFPRERSARHIPFPDAKATLGQLRRRCKLGMVTNGAPGIQREKLMAADLGAWFDVIGVSCEVGMGKPEPDFFLEVLERLGVHPHEALMVGDSLERDVRGAQAVGIRAVHIDFKEARVDREAKDTPTGIESIEPDARIARLTELVDLVERYGS
jgi:putative hydrolase of the HAD superfamily